MADFSLDKMGQQTEWTPPTTLGGLIVNAGLRAYDSFKDRSKLPTNEQIFLESILDKDRSPITEKRLTEADKNAIRQVVAGKYEKLKEPFEQYKTHLEGILADKNNRQSWFPEELRQARKDLTTVNDFLAGKLTPDIVNLAAGKVSREQYGLLNRAGLYTNMPNSTQPKTPFNVKPNVQYEDYAGGNKQKALSQFNESAGNTNTGAMQTTLGRFNYTVDPNGQLHIKDQYDFNPPDANTMAEGRYEAAGAMNPLYQPIREYAGEQMPPGHGREVSITIPMNDPKMQGLYSWLQKKTQ
jgi:hypothetical protein